MVQFSFRHANADYLGFEATPEGIIKTACKAEALGFDAVYVNDHIIVDGSPRSAAWTNTYDPLIALSFIAAHTSRIRLGTSVLIMPYRNPITTAKMLASLDQMSGGRVIAGVGVGWNEAEFNALRRAVPWAWAALTNTCASGRPAGRQARCRLPGNSLRFNMHVSPKPLQQPHPPLWIGGSSRAALRRAARLPRSGNPRPRLGGVRQRQAYLRQACEQIGRKDVPPTRMSFRTNFSKITAAVCRRKRRGQQARARPARGGGRPPRYRQEAGWSLSD